MASRHKSIAARATCMSDELKRAHEEYKAALRALGAANGAMAANLALAVTMRNIGNEGIALQHYYVKRLTRLATAHAGTITAMADQLAAELNEVRDGG